MHCACSHVTDLDINHWSLPEAGFNPADVGRWVPAYTAALTNPNLFLELRTPRAYVVLRQWNALARVALNASAAIVEQLSPSPVSPPPRVSVLHAPVPPAMDLGDSTNISSLGYGDDTAPGPNAAASSPPPSPSRSAAQSPVDPSSGKPSVNGGSRRIQEAANATDDDDGGYAMVAAALPSLLPPQLVARLHTEFDAAMQRAESAVLQDIAATGLDTFLRQYRASINWMPPAPPPPSPPPPSPIRSPGRRHELEGGIVAAIVVPIGMVAVAVIGVMVVWVVRSGRHWRKPIKPPMDDLDSVTLCVTDIEVCARYQSIRYQIPYIYCIQDCQLSEGYQLVRYAGMGGTSETSQPLRQVHDACLGMLAAFNPYTPTA